MRIRLPYLDECLSAISDIYERGFDKKIMVVVVEVVALRKWVVLTIHMVVTIGPGIFAGFRWRIQDGTGY